MMHLPTLGVQPGLLLFAFTTVPVTAQTLVTCWSVGYRCCVAL